MKLIKALFIVLAFTGCLNGEILRIGLVAEKLKPGYSLHELGEGDGKQELFIKDEGFLTEADVKTVNPSPTRPDAVDITLNEEGTKKMIAVTEKMRPGIDRLAIVVNGKVLSAPVLQSIPLGKNFVIIGLKEKGEVAKFVASLSGKSR